MPLSGNWVLLLQSRYYIYLSMCSVGGFLPATLVFNFVGACIFFPIDVWIFRHSHKNKGDK